MLIDRFEEGNRHKTKSVRSLYLPGFLRKGYDFLHFLEMEQNVLEPTPEVLSTSTAT